MLKLITFTASIFAAASAIAFSPQAGTWAVTDEINGEPGRGIALDVQDDIVIMQIYAYKDSGDSAFYLYTAPLVNNASEGPLHTYIGGRHFGSGPLIGIEDQSPGNVSLRFINGTEGFITFPGEPEKHFSRFNVYGNTPSSLLGEWSFLANSQILPLGYNRSVTTNTGAKTDNGTGIATNSAGTFACEHMIQGFFAGEVLCFDFSGAQWTRSYSFKLSVNDGNGLTLTPSGTGAELIARRMTTRKGTEISISAKQAGAIAQQFQQAASELEQPHKQHMLP